MTREEASDVRNLDFHTHSGCYPYHIPFRIAPYFKSRKMMLPRSVVPFFYSDSIIYTIPAYSILMFRSISAYRNILAPLVVRSDSLVVRLQM